MSFDASLFTHSPLMRDVALKVARAGLVRAGVLIRGERGTGRSRVARAVHAHEGDLRRPFVPVDCSAVDPGDFELQLFGCAPRGNGGSVGFERIAAGSALHEANGGTLYLQNLSDLSARAQSRLARVLRDREVIMTGSGVTELFDVRPMAGVEPSIEESVRDGRLREDLFRRLSTVQIDVPPLRDRREDIPALASHFVADACARIGRPPRALSNAARLLITALPWRGNAAELRALLDAVVLDGSSGPSIGIENVLAHLQLDGGSVALSDGGTLRQARARFERDYILSVLERHNGRISDAARALGIQRTNLYRKMRALRVDRIKKDTTLVRS